jgi:hypothetical protein
MLALILILILAALVSNSARNLIAGLFKLIGGLVLMLVSAAIV